MGKIYVRHSSGCRSSWYRLYGDFEIDQESITEIIETVVSSDSEADHWPNFRRFIGGSSCGEKRLCWLTELFSLQLQKPGSFLTQCYVWEVSVLNQSKHWKARLNGLWKHVFIFWDLIRIDGEKMEFEWTNFPGYTTLGILDEIQETMTTELKCEPEHFKGRIIFMPMYNDVDWGKTRNQRKLYCECSQCYWICSKIHTRTLVISRAWIGEEMVKENWKAKGMKRDQPLLQCWFLGQYWERTILHCTWWWYTWHFERIMSRSTLYLAVRKHPTWKMGPWNHEDRSSLGCDGLLSSRTLRCGDHDRIFFSYRERNQRIRNQNVRRDSCFKCCARKCRKLVVKAWPRPTPIVTLSPRQPRRVKIHDQTTATRRAGTPERRWSSKIWRSGRIV